METMAVKRNRINIEVTPFESHREPVEITRHGRREFVLMSAAQYDQLLSAAQRRGETVEAASEPEQN